MTVKGRIVVAAWTVADGTSAVRVEASASVNTRADVSADAGGARSDVIRSQNCVTR